MGVLLSDKAAFEIKQIIEQQGLPAGQTSLRVAIKGGGCSGFTYLLDLTEDAAGEADERQESHGLNILVDFASSLYLDGVEIDFKQEAIGKGFVFKNPNPTNTCGCGSSITE